jgi:solute carrier family 50 protein (sugar transporter)
MGNVMFLAPRRDVKTAVERGSLGDLNPTPWAFMLGNCCGWVIYSYILQNYFIFFANAPGFVLSVYYCLSAVKLQYQDHRAREMRQSFVHFLESSRSSSIQIESSSQQQQQQQQQLLNDGAVWQKKAKDLATVVLQVTSQQTPAPAGHEKLVMAMVLLWLCVISTISFANKWDSPSTNQMVVGIIVNLNLAFFYAAPLFTIFRVLKTRNSVSIHIRTMVTNTLNGSFWTAYGLAVQDPFIWVPNGLGAILGVIQFCLCVLFPRRSGTSTSIIANQGDGGDEPQQQQQQQGETAIEIKGLDDDNHQDTTIEEGIISPSNSNESVTDALKLKQ